MWGGDGVGGEHMIEEYTIKGRSVDAEDTRAGGIADKIVEGFVIEMQCTMNKIWSMIGLSR